MRLSILMGGQRISNHIIDKIIQQKIILRESTQVEWGVLAVFLYHAGLSYLEVRCLLTSIPALVQVRNLPN